MFSSVSRIFFMWVSRSTCAIYSCCARIFSFALCGRMSQHVHYSLRFLQNKTKTQVAYACEMCKEELVLSGFEDSLYFCTVSNH